MISTKENTTVANRPLVLISSEVRLRRLLAVAALLAGGCGGGSDPPPAPPPLDAAADADPGTPQRPPVGQAAVEAWLAQAFYRAWTCEDRSSRPG